MSSKTLTISLPEEMLVFLNENPSLSPSKVMQGAIQNIENSLKSNPQLIAANKEIDRLKKALQFCNNKYQEIIQRLEDDGVLNKYVV